MPCPPHPVLLLLERLPSSLPRTGLPSRATTSLVSLGWPLPFDDLHHRKSIIVNVGIHSPNAREEIAELIKISNEIAPIDGIQIIAFPTDEFGPKFTDQEFLV